MFHLLRRGLPALLAVLRQRPQVRGARLRALDAHGAPPIRDASLVLVLGPE